MKPGHGRRRVTNEKIGKMRGNRLKCSGREEDEKQPLSINFFYLTKRFRGS